MRNISSLMNYHFSLTIKTTKMLMPLLFWVLFMPVSYSIFPLDLVSSVLVSCIVLFYLMVWIGMSYYDIEDSINEQLLVLKTKSENMVYLSKLLFLFSVSIVMSLIGIFAPIIINAINGFNIFTRPLTLGDIIASFFLHLFLALLGAALGGLFHPRIMKNRKTATLITFLIAIMSLVKLAITNNYHILKFMLWVLPPVSDFAQIFTDEDFFSPVSLIKIIVLISIYILAYMTIQIVLLKRKKF